MVQNRAFRVSEVPHAVMHRAIVAQGGCGGVCGNEFMQLLVVKKLFGGGFVAWTPLGCAAFALDAPAVRCYLPRFTTNMGRTAMRFGEAWIAGLLLVSTSGCALFERERSSSAPAEGGNAFALPKDYVQL